MRGALKQPEAEIGGSPSSASSWATMSTEYAQVAKDESVEYDESLDVMREDKSSDGCCKAVSV